MDRVLWRHCAVTMGYHPEEEDLLVLARSLI